MFVGQRHEVIRLVVHKRVVALSKRILGHAETVLERLRWRHSP